MAGERSRKAFLFSYFLFATTSAAFAGTFDDAKTASDAAQSNLRTKKLAAEKAAQKQDANPSGENDRAATEAKKQVLAAQKLATSAQSALDRASLTRTDSSTTGDPASRFRPSGVQSLPQSKGQVPSESPADQLPVDIRGRVEISTDSTLGTEKEDKAISSNRDLVNRQAATSAATTVGAAFQPWGAVTSVATERASTAAAFNGVATSPETLAGQLADARSMLGERQINQIVLANHGLPNGNADIGPNGGIPWTSDAMKPVLDQIAQINTTRAQAGLAPADVTYAACYGSSCGQYIADRTGSPVTAVDTLAWGEAAGVKPSVSASKGGRVTTFTPRK